MHVQEKLLNAIIKSIKHWEKDILKKLKDGDQAFLNPAGILFWKVDETEVSCYEKDCPLCLHRNKYSIYSISDSCLECPLFKCTKIDCNESGSSWSNWLTYPSEKTANAMIRDLKKTLLWYLQELKISGEIYEKRISDIRSKYGKD